MVSDSIKTDTIILNNNIENIINVNDSLFLTTYNSLDERLKLLENSDNLDSDTIITLSITLLIAVVNFLFVYISYIKDKKRSYLVNLSNEYNDTEERFVNVSKNSDDTEDIAIKLEKVLNIIEIMCYHYLKNDVDKKDFDFRYKSQIYTYYETFGEYYGDGMTSYDKTIEYVNLTMNKDEE